MSVMDKVGGMFGGAMGGSTKSTVFNNPNGDPVIDDVLAVQPHHSIADAIKAAAMSYITGGTVSLNEGQKGAPPVGENTFESGDGSTAGTMGSVDLAKQAHSSFLSDSSANDNTKDKPQAQRTLFSPSNTWGQDAGDAMSLRNGGIQRRAITDLSKGLSGEGWSL